MRAVADYVLLATKGDNTASVEVAILLGHLATADADRPEEMSSRLQAALAVFADMAKSEPTSDRAQYLAGVSYYLLWRNDEKNDQLRANADAHLKAAAAAEPANGFFRGASHWYLAMILEHQGKPEDALSHWKKAEESLPPTSPHRSSAAKRVAEIQAFLNQ